MNKDKSDKLAFAGVDSRDTFRPPDWWYAPGGSLIDDIGDEAVSFLDAIRRLPRAMEADVSWRNPKTGRWIRTERHNALIDPDRVVDTGQTDQSKGDGPDDEDALWHIPTSDYEIINPSQFLNPLADAILDMGLENSVFGAFELFRRGGRVRGDIYFDTHTIDLDHIESDPVMLGLEVGWDFFGARAAYAQGLAMDTNCRNSMRRLTDRISVRHQGNVSDRIDFWDDLLRRIDLMIDHLAEMIISAEAITLNLADLPFDITEFFRLLGFPSYLANRSVEDVRANSTNPFEPTLWELHSGATYALTHHARGSADSIQQYYGRANDLLMNPVVAVERIEEDYERKVSADDGLHSAGTEGGGQARVAELGRSIEEKRQLFESRQEKIEALFQRA